MIHQLVYLSFARQEINHEGLTDILEVSMRNNARDGITGVLMYHDRIFFQILEGEAGAVRKCYDRVAQDDRHGIISLISDTSAVKRSFSSWLMGYAGPDRIGQYTKHSLPGLADLLGNKDKMESRSGGALTLAREMFCEFRG